MAFVGRAQEVERLMAAADSAAAGEVASIVVIGDPGSGKSRLLSEAASRARLDRQLYVAGYESERDVPLAAATPLLRRLTELPQHGPRLDALVFGDPEPADALASLRIFEAAFRALCELTPAILVVDDLQWADPLSVSLCHYLLRAARDTGEGLSLFAAARPSPAGAAFEAETVGELHPLEPEHSLELVGTLAPDLEPGRARQISDRSGGFPFWIEALVRTSDVDA